VIQMDEHIAFSELLARIPRGKRTDRVHTLTALWKIQTDRSSSAPTSEIAALLKRHLRGKSPRNVSDVLAKLTPHAERVLEGANLRWRITDSGLRYLGDLIGLTLGGRIQCVLDLSRLHSRIYLAAKDLFIDQHYSEAVGRAAKELNKLVRERTRRDRDDGVTMMHQVFSETENNFDRLVITALDEEWKRDLQRGLRFMMVGCQSGIANVDKHGNLLFASELEALECLAMISHLARQVDRTATVKPIGAAESALGAA